MKTVLKVTLVFAAVAGSFSSFAQCKEWKWPADKAKAEESLVLIDDAIKNKQPKQGIHALAWLLANAPDLNTKIYIDGAELYDMLAEQEKDAVRKQVYVDSLMIIYDLRIKSCGEEANVTGRKALSGFKYNINTPKAPEVLQLMDKSFELNGNSVMDGSIVPYMQTVRINFLKFKNLTEDQIFERYDRIQGVLDAKIKKAQSEGKPTDKYKKMKDDIDAILVTLVKVDCNFVKKNLEPKFRKNPTDIGLAKKIFYFMLKDNCTDDPLWLETGEAIHKAEPDFGLIKNLGVKYMSREQFDKAQASFEEAQKLATEPGDKADISIYLGGLEAKKGNKAAARQFFRQALDFDGSKKEAYEKIGDLYYNSFNDCKKEQNMADDRAVYLIAYDYYAKAGEGKKMQAAKEQFPSKEEIFLVNYQSGQNIRVGCWIGESTTIRTRD